jgi:hypothetical protein
MPQPKKTPVSATPESWWKRLKKFVTGTLLSVMAVLILSGLVDQFGDFWGQAATLTKAIIITVATIVAGLMVAGLAMVFFNRIKEDRAKQASKRVAEALDALKSQTPVADISTEAVAATLKDAKVSSEQLARIVEQGKQKLLIDEDYFREEVGTLIVDYLQPLPRNVKRLLNRFRVNLLIAHSRGLMSSEPKVTTPQIGKWLVLVERWPQLGRSMSADPERMVLFEEQSTAPAPEPSDAEATDPFMESVKVLSPFYFGDEDLRTFIHSDPPLAPVLARLVHYGDAPPPPPAPQPSVAGSAASLTQTLQ